MNIKDQCYSDWITMSLYVLKVTKVTSQYISQLKLCPLVTSGVAFSRMESMVTSSSVPIKLLRLHEINRNFTWSWNVDESANVWRENTFNVTEVFVFAEVWGNPGPGSTAIVVDWVLFTQRLAMVFLSLCFPSIGYSRQYFFTHCILLNFILKLKSSLNP